MLHSADPVFDETHLWSFTDGDRGLMAEVLRLFLAQESEYFAGLDAAGANEKAWREAAHRLKGAARAIGAKRLARMAALAETSAPGTGVAPLQAEFACLRKVLERMIGPLSDA
ncbi:MAG: Hpt domain-containing protein [Rhodothalassiaceae bacterium]